MGVVLKFVRKINAPRRMRIDNILASRIVSQAMFIVQAATKETITVEDGSTFETELIKLHALCLEAEATGEPEP